MPLVIMLLAAACSRIAAEMSPTTATTRSVRPRNCSIERPASPEDSAPRELTQPLPQALLDTRPLGLSLQIDEGDAVFDAKVGNLHALFRR